MGIKININSEYERLRTVIVHEPGKEIERITPLNKDQLLFDDVPYLKRMQEEHRKFVKELEKNEVTCLEIRQLLKEVLENDEDGDYKEEILLETLEIERCRGIDKEKFLALDTERFIDILFAGITYDEWEEMERGNLGNMNMRGEEKFIINPIPNIYFTRDPSAAIKNGIVSCKMFKDERIRESFIMKYIFKFHRDFRENVFFWYGENEGEDRPHTIEGGDIIVLDEKTIAVGNSQRTKCYTIEKLAENLFERGDIDEVYEIKIPPDRIFMHLDTVFTVISDDMVILYPDVFKEEMKIVCYRPSRKPGKKVSARVITSTLKHALSKVMGKSIITLQTGKGIPFIKEREQFADGTNTLAIAPREVITYERNEKTNQELDDHDVKVHPIAGSELVRGRGGPRCMSMPLERG